MKPKEGREDGFTIIEMIIVITVLAFAYALAAPAISNWFDRPRLDGAVDEIKTSLSEARAKAITTSKNVGYSIPAAGYRNIKISQSGSLIFYIDGSSSGGSVTLKGANQTRVIKVNWLTGRISEAEE